MWWYWDSLVVVLGFLVWLLVVCSCCVVGGCVWCWSCCWCDVVCVMVVLLFLWLL